MLFLNRAPEEAAAELYDLLGDNAFEAIEELMEHRCAAGFRVVWVCGSGSTSLVFCHCENIAAALEGV